jgi:hypothetical protein
MKRYLNENKRAARFLTPSWPIPQGDESCKKISTISLAQREQNGSSTRRS